MPRQEGELENDLQRAGKLVTSYDMIETGHTLGEGGFSKVFKAKLMSGEGLLVAVKKLKVLKESN